MSDVTFLLWSGKHEAWWRHRGFGYTTDIDRAGRFTEAQAIKHVVKSALGGDRTQVTSMVVAPDSPPDALDRTAPETVDRAVRALIENRYVGDVGELNLRDLEEIVNIVLSATEQAP